MGSCPACISYASKLGLISTHMAGALQQINDLRNAFAHYKQPRETRIVASHAKAIFDLLTPAQRRGAVAARTLFGPKMNEASHSPARQEFEAAACVLIADIDQLMPHRKSVGRPKLTRSSQVMPRFSIRQRASATRQGQRACRTPGAGTGETKGEVGMEKRVPFVAAIVFSVAAVVGCNSTETPTQEAHEQGERAFDKGELDLAINCFSEAIRLDPNNVMAYRGVPFPIILSQSRA